MKFPEVYESYCVQYSIPESRYDEKLVCVPQPLATCLTNICIVEIVGAAWYQLLPAMDRSLLPGARERAQAALPAAQLPS